MIRQGAARKKYIIHAPRLSKSNGIRALYTLYEILRAKGYEAFIHCPGENRGHYHYMNDVARDTRLRDIAVYPEIVSGNPLRFQNVVRYVLFYPGKIGGDKFYHPRELVFTWDARYYDAPELFLPCLDRSLFFDEKLPKTQDCRFVHKRGKWREVKEAEGLTEINMDYPSSREELARLLKTTGTLYSFDESSLLNLEALSCGARVKIITADGIRDCLEADFERFRPEAIDRSVNRFIQLTQNMSYFTGE